MGLIIRDQDEGTVQFAHHTIRQYLLSDIAKQRSGAFACSLREAELFVGEMCLTYLAFSDFDTHLEVRLYDTTTKRPTNDILMEAVFWMPHLPRVRSSFLDRLHWLHSGQSSPNTKYVKPSPIFIACIAPSREILAQYRLLSYVIEYWMWYSIEADQRFTGV